MKLTDLQLRAILNRESKGLRESGLPWTADDIIDNVVQELVFRREENAKNDVYIEGLEKRLEPCTCESGKCWQHD